LDPVRNPYAPGAGSRPPELAGREELLERARIALARLAAGRSDKSLLLVGLRGVGKTVLLVRMRQDAEQAGVCVLVTEAEEGRSLPALLAPQLRVTLVRLRAWRQGRIQRQATHALGVLASFVARLKLKYRDIEIGLDVSPKPGLADSGELAADLQDLLKAAGAAARAAETCIAIFVDELQCLEGRQLTALIMALHAVAQEGLPVMAVGAGLPQLLALVSHARSYAERLFDVVTLGPLGAEDAKRALVRPAAREEVRFQPAALTELLRQTGGYPYFIQEWGKQVWDFATASPITLQDVNGASQQVEASLDEGFFRMRLERLAPAEIKYLRAMAELGPGPHRSGDIAGQALRPVQALAPVRRQLIVKGLIWSPAHGDTAFTVPLFDEFLLRRSF